MLRWRSPSPGHASRGRGAHAKHAAAALAGAVAVAVGTSSAVAMSPESFDVSATRDFDFAGPTTLPDFSNSTTFTTSAQDFSFGDVAGTTIFEPDITASSSSPTISSFDFRGVDKILALADFTNSITPVTSFDVSNVLDPTTPAGNETVSAAPAVIEPLAPAVTDGLSPAPDAPAVTTPGGSPAVPVVTGESDSGLVVRDVSTAATATPAPVVVPVTDEAAVAKPGSPSSGGAESVIPPTATPPGLGEFTGGTSLMDLDARASTAAGSAPLPVPIAEAGAPARPSPGEGGGTTDSAPSLATDGSEAMTATSNSSPSDLWHPGAWGDLALATAVVSAELGRDDSRLGVKGGLNRPRAATTPSTNHPAQAQLRTWQERFSSSPNAGSELNVAGITSPGDTSILANLLNPVEEQNTTYEMTITPATDQDTSYEMTVTEPDEGTSYELIVGPDTTSPPSADTTAPAHRACLPGVECNIHLQPLNTATPLVYAVPGMPTYIYDAIDRAISYFNEATVVKLQRTTDAGAASIVINDSYFRDDALGAAPCYVSIGLTCLKKLVELNGDMIIGQSLEHGRDLDTVAQNVVAHEICHNLGCDHDWIEDGLMNISSDDSEIRSLPPSTIKTLNDAYRSRFPHLITK